MVAKPAYSAASARSIDCGGQGVEHAHVGGGAGVAEDGAGIAQAGGACSALATDVVRFVVAAAHGGGDEEEGGGARGADVALVHGFPCVSSFVV